MEANCHEPTKLYETEKAYLEQKSLKNESFHNNTKTSLQNLSQLAVILFIKRRETQVAVKMVGR